MDGLKHKVLFTIILVLLLLVFAGAMLLVYVRMQAKLPNEGWELFTAFRKACGF